MTLDKFIAGIEILRKHYANPNGYHIGAEHDQFFMYATDTPLSPEYVEKLGELGWFQPEQNEGEGYDPKNGWSAFT